MPTISPFLWFDSSAEEAAELYASAFPDAHIRTKTHYGKEGAEVSGRKEGTVMTVEMDIMGMHFSLLNGGPVFQFTPATSFSVHCNSKEEAKKLWDKLIDGGKALMEFGEYPFSNAYGWLNDKFGVSWQINYVEGIQKILPSLLFVGDAYGKAEEAMKMYTSIFADSSIDMIDRYNANQGEKEEAVRYGLCTLAGTQFVLMDSGMNHQFGFSQAVSYVITVETQEEVDYFWEKLSQGGQTQPCGWLLDTFGIAWQVVPKALEKLMSGPDPEKAQRVMAAMLKMSKIDIAALEKASIGE